MGEDEIENQKEFESFLSQSLKSNSDLDKYLKLESGSQEKIYRKLKDQRSKKLIPGTGTKFKFFGTQNFSLSLVVFIVSVVSIFSFSTLNHRKQIIDDSSKIDTESISEVDSAINEIDTAIATLDYSVWEINDIGVSY
jgi:hypothetical protein